MRIKIITLTLLLSAAALLVQCRTKPATEQGSGVVSKTEVTKTDSTSEDEDSVAVLPNGNEPQAVTVVPQGEPHKGFVYVKNIIPDWWAVTQEVQLARWEERENEKMMLANMMY